MMGIVASYKHDRGVLMKIRPWVNEHNLITCFFCRAHHRVCHELVSGAQHTVMCEGCREELTDLLVKYEKEIEG